MDESAKNKKKKGFMMQNKVASGSSSERRDMTVLCEGELGYFKQEGLCCSD